MLYFTHFFDLLAKVISLGAGVALVTPLRDFVSPEMLPMVVIAAITLAGVLWYFIFRPLSSWGYANFRLGAKLSFRESKKASVLFAPLRDLGQWQSMIVVKSMPSDMRVAAINQAASDVSVYYEGRAEELRKAPASCRGVLKLLWVLLLVCVPGVIANIPPFSWLADLQSSGMDGKYYPVISLIIVTLPIAIAIRVVEKSYGIRSARLLTK